MEIRNMKGEAYHCQFHLLPWQQEMLNALIKGAKVTVTGGHRGGKRAVKRAAIKEIKGQCAHLIIIDEADGLNLNNIKPKISLDSPRKVEYGRGDE